MSDESSSPCGHCGQAANKRCGGCKNMQYCTPECQQADWQYHKYLCKTFADFTERPSPNVRRAIFLPQNGDKPHFIWVPVKSGAGSNSKTRIGMMVKNTPDADAHTDWGVPDADTLPGYCLPNQDNPVGAYGSKASAMSMVCGTLRRGELLDHSIWMMMRKNVPASAPNLCFRRLAKPNEPVMPLNGPLLLIGMSKVKFSNFTVDLDTRDFTLGIDAAIDLGPPGQAPWHAQKVQAVKVNKTAPFLEALKVSRQHPVFRNSDTGSAIGELGSIPLRSWTYPTSSNSGSSNGSAVDSITTSATLPTTLTFDPNLIHTIIDPTSPDFGRIPQAIQKDSRSQLIVFRAENGVGVDLTIDCLEVMLGTIQNRFLPMLAEDGSGDAPAERCQRVKEFIPQLKAKAKEAKEGASSGANVAGG